MKTERRKVWINQKCHECGQTVSKRKEGKVVKKEMNFCWPEHGNPNKNVWILCDECKKKLLK